MPFPDLLDLAALLTPIPGDSPAGPDLRTDFSPDSVYHRLKDARHRARTIERQLELDYDAATNGERPDWSPLLETIPGILASQAKDLELAVWLTEALVRAHGFAGLRDGLRLTRRLVAEFWEDLHPRPDEDGVSTRVAALAGLNGDATDGTLARPVRGVPITAGSSVGPFSHADYLQTLYLDRLDNAGERARRIEHGAVTRQVFEQAVTETPPEFFRTLLEDLSTCEDEFAQLCSLLDERCGKDADGYPLAPPSSNIRNVLVECRETVTVIAKDVLAVDEADATIGEGVAGAAGVPTGPIASRAEALQALLRVAQYFKDAEPHSPVSYALEQVVRWGRLPLPDLLLELLPDDSARQRLFRLVGIPPNEGRGGSL